jgi:two-component system, OmpR family, sensor histidine kinase QseC
MSEDFRAQPSLATTIGLDLGKVALATVVVVSAVVFTLHYLDYDHLYLDHVNYEAQSLLGGVKEGPRGLSFALPRHMRRYSEDEQPAYGFRVRDQGGNVIAAKQSALLETVSPWSAKTPITSDFWFMKLDADLPYHFAGGRKLRLGDADVLIEIITLGDPDGIHWLVALHETGEDWFLPVLPLALMIPAVTIISIRRALRPLARAARQAETVNPADATQRLELAGMPRETAAFASAINRLMERVSALVQSEKIFVGSVAHQLRTPLAVMLLELEKIDHPRARRLEADVKGLAEYVDRLVLLARMETMQTPELIDVDLAAVAGEAIDPLHNWAAARDHRIAVSYRNPQRLRGDPVAIREALRNLVENAVKHTPAGTSIAVTVGPDSTVTVEDSGPGLASTEQPFRRGDPAKDGAGLGLTIVRQAVELHRGSIEVGRSSLGGALFRLTFA